MRRKFFDYSKFDKNIDVKEIDGKAILSYYNVHGDLTREMIGLDKKEERIEEIKRERYNFELLDDSKVIYPLRD